MLFAAACLVLTLIYTAAAQFKLKNGRWWRGSIIGWCLRKIRQFIRFCFRGVRKIYRMLPLIWQWLLTAAAMVIIPLICLLLALNSWGFFRFIFTLWTITAILGDISMVLYGAYAFGILIRGAKKMAQGNLNEKIPTRHLFGAFKDFALSLNDLADAATIAAQKQMQSERMKTELITNVSHDIKTPLTSIINYVDLLQAPHTQEQGQQYLDVLSRQSARMKKLVEDLMDMSKASSGNLQVNVTTLDSSEVISQALGEFSDKLTSAQLTPVFQAPEAPVLMRADGRHTWRVLSNLLSNTVKYAMPGTRLYIDLVSLPGSVQISLKNISAEPLNVSAEELTERFVRGDASRNTEGSGLGLNIAKSLMELQQGNLELLVDGDLFKVTLTFPAE
jgi:signal transduction histidine kinase